MKNILIVLIIIVFVSTGFILIRNYYNVDVGVFTSNLVPTKERAINTLPQGSDTNNSFKIPDGFRMAVFAELDGAPRDIELDTDGNLVASIPEKGKIVALPDKNNDGIVDNSVDIVTDLNRPHSMAFEGGYIYVAETDRVRKYGYGLENKPDVEPETLFNLPSGGRHWTRTIKINENKLYTSVGSSCDVCAEGDKFRSAILVSDLDGKNLDIFASGLRNTVFFEFYEGKMWGNDMGRDFLGDDSPPDELNIIEQNGNYGWPYCYGDKIRDKNFKPNESMGYCENTKDTTYNYQAHVAPLGLVFIKSPLFPEDEQGDILVAFHGSWNRSDRVGYKIVKLDRDNNTINNEEDFITGWISNNQIIGRPVDMVFDKKGVLYISDDNSNLIYILTKEDQQ